MVTNKEIHSVFQQNKLSYDSKEGKYKDSFIQVSMETFYELDFNRILTAKAIELYWAIYSETDLGTNTVQRPLTYWEKKINKAVPKDEADKKRIENKWSNQVTNLKKYGMISVKYGAPKTEAGSNKINEREYSIYSINTFEEALKIQVKNGLRPAEDLALIGKKGEKITLNVYEEIKAEAKQSMTVVEAVITETVEIQEEKEEMRYNPNEPTKQEMEAYYRQQEEKSKQSKMATKGKSVNLLKENVVYYHPVLTGATAPSLVQNEETGEFIEQYNTENNKPNEYSIEDFIKRFYTEFNVPSSKMNINRDMGFLRSAWASSYFPAAQSIQVEVIDLMLYTLDTAKYLSYDTDKKIDDLAQLTPYIDEAVLSMGDKKTALADNESAQEAIKEMDIQKAIELDNILYEYESKLSYAPHIIAGAFQNKFPEVDLEHLKKYLQETEEEFVFETYMQSL